MRLLLTNDDGIDAPGLAVLERVARTLSDDVWVVSPEADQSGLSHSLTLSDPMRLRQLGERRFALRGTPADCVIMAARRILGGRPDLLLSGVNRGQNAADDVTYSGTVAGAIEGTLIGIPSISLSQCFAWNDDTGDVPWETAEAFAAPVIRHLLAFGFPQGVLYNINFPDRPVREVGGVHITHQGRLLHSLFIEERVDPRGTPYFWLGYKRQPREKVPGTDLYALDTGMVSVTPLRIDLTDYDLATKLRLHFADAPIAASPGVAG